MPPARISCFPPVMDNRTQVLILGSLPGGMSLIKREYYAHPHNHFWRLLGSALGINVLPQFSYENRLRLIQHLGIGLWSSLASGERGGSSLDSKIKDPEPIDILTGLLEHGVEDVRAIFFDGRLAEEVFMTNVHWQLPTYYQSTIEFDYLPSSSSAYAAMQFRMKSRIWRRLIRRHLSHFSEKRNRG